LVNFLNTWVELNPDEDYANVRPKLQRCFPPGLEYPAYHPVYVKYEAILNDLSIDPKTGIPLIPNTQRPITHRKDLPSGSKPDVNIELGFRKEMVKVGTLCLKP
jgi:hypothetical protein